MRRMRRDPLDDMVDRMQNIFEEFQDMGRDITGLGGVPVDMHEEDGDIVVRADLPGVEKEDISLRADEDSLEIAAEGSEEVTEENEKYFRRERASRSYRRTVAWPAPVDVNTVSAEFEDGVLEVRVEKEEDEDGRDIEID